MAYNRLKATEYALKWALSRNPQYYNYDELGGDCTNFISQCLYAGTGEMNYRGYGWYYINANQKSPSWTGVRFLYEFLIQIIQLLAILYIQHQYHLLLYYLK